MQFSHQPTGRTPLETKLLQIGKMTGTSEKNYVNAVAL
jgi:hypothetical protein